METIEQAILKAYKQGITDQQAIFDKLPKVKAWIARDKDGVIYLFVKKPIKEEEWWFSETEEHIILTEYQLPEGCNPKWEDEEPIEVELTIKMKG